MENLFYPADFRKLIKELQEQGDLNKQALSSIRWHWISPLLFGLTLGMVSLFYQQSFLVFLAFILGGIALAFISVRGGLKNFIIPYTFGMIAPATLEQKNYIDVIDPFLLGIIKKSPLEKSKGKISLLIGHGGARGGWELIYSFTGYKGFKRRGGAFYLKKKWLDKNFPETGEEIKILIHPHDDRINKPIIPALLGQYCLSKKRISELGALNG